MMLPLRLRAAFGYGQTEVASAAPPVSEEPELRPASPSSDLPTVDGTSRWLSLDRDGRLTMSIPELYHRLQNVSDCALHSCPTQLTVSDPHALPIAHRFLQRMTADSLGDASADDSACVLSLPTRFDPKALKSWIGQGNAATAAEYQAYVKRRHAGEPREMFVDYADAVRSSLCWLD